MEMSRIKTFRTCGRKKTMLTFGDMRGRYKFPRSLTGKTHVTVSELLMLLKPLQRKCFKDTCAKRLRLQYKVLLEGTNAGHYCNMALLQPLTLCLQDIVCESVNWIQLSRDRDQERALL
jgi:hypothetical protein